MKRRDLLKSSVVVAAAAPALAQGEAHHHHPTPATPTTTTPPTTTTTPASTSLPAPRPKTPLTTPLPGAAGKVITPNGVTLPVVDKGGVKVMHLIAGELEHEIAPGLQVTAWGYNGRTSGPTIEVTEGDRVRIYVTNQLPEPTTVHWHGLRLENGMDGVSGLTQKPIRTGQTFKYEFTCHHPGTYMYHPHFDEMTQMALGMMGVFIVHPKKDPAPVDHDFALMLSTWSITPGASRPNPMAMSDFNILTINSRAYPGTAPLVVEQGKRVRLRFANLSAMDHHSMHLHGHAFSVVATDGGAVPAAARFPETTTLVHVGSTRVVEFVADAAGDWPLHCHMTHHAMNQMGHGIPSMVGAQIDDIAVRLQKLSPSTMVMGDAGMGGMDHMFHMGMKMPENSIPMLGGKGPFAAIEMGGMFTVLKVRPRDQLGDEWYRHPPGTVADVASDADLAADGIKV